MNERLNDDLNEAYEAFHRNPDVLREELLNALSEQQPEQQKRGRRQSPVHRLLRGPIMNHRITQLAAAAAILIAAMVGIHFLGGSADGTSVAWGDVLDNVEAARTVMYTREFEKGNEREVAIIRIIDPYLCRSDMVQGSGGYDVGIINTLKNKCLTFFPRTKTAVISDEDGYPGLQLRTYEKIKRDLRDGTEKDLGRVKLNGRDTVCFEISRETGKTTVWADPNTALPIQIETISNENGRTRTLMSDIRFDMELDERLFEPPADYCLLDLDTQILTTPFELTEQHLLEGLAVYPKYLGGKFRTRYIGGRPLTDKVRKKCAAEVQRLSWSDEEAHKSTLGCAFIEQLPEDSDYQYVGEDVQVGDAATAVCWYKPQGSATYRVVYGDLSIRDVAPEDLPPIPWLTDQK